MIKLTPAELAIGMTSDINGVYFAPSDAGAPTDELEILDDEPDMDCHCGHPECGAC